MGLDLNNSVIKRLWCIYKRKYDDLPAQMVIFNAYTDMLSFQTKN